jgi:hypothetical protein
MDSLLEIKVQAIENGGDAAHLEKKIRREMLLHALLDTDEFDQVLSTELFRRLEWFFGYTGFDRRTPEENAVAFLEHNCDLHAVVALIAAERIVSDHADEEVSSLIGGDS